MDSPPTGTAREAATTTTTTTTLTGGGRDLELWTVSLTSDFFTKVVFNIFSKPMKCRLHMFISTYIFCSEALI